MTLSAQDLVAFLGAIRNVGAVDAETPLFSGGTVDSVGMVELIAWLESKTGIAVEHADVTLENFDSISRILAFVQAKRS